MWGCGGEEWGWRVGIEWWSGGEEWGWRVGCGGEEVWG